jgi:hypothetical protein
MATTHRNSSAYYPPRARWYSPLFYLSDDLGRRLALDRLDLGNEMNAGELLVGLLVPGLAFYFCSPRILGKVALVAAGVLLLTFLILLGHRGDNLIFGMLLSLHVSGVVHYCTPLFKNSLSNRLLATVATLFILTLLIYLPAQRVLQRYLLMPLRIDGHVVVVRHIFSGATIRRDDWIAYNISGSETYEEGGVYTHSGIVFGPVLAMPGDKVEFSKTSFSVNGQSHPSFPHMPQSGSLIIPQNQWLIWPNLAINERRNVAEARIENTLLHLALVDEGQLIGKPFQKWFWRRQILS